MTDLPGSPTFEDLEEMKPETPTSGLQAAVDRAREQEKADRAAAQPPKRGRGRPKGSKTRRSSSPAPEPEPEPDEDDDRPPTPAELRGVGAMWGVVWSVAARSGRVRPLVDSEKLELAEATIPVLKKYAPMFERYAVEINLGFVLVGTIMSTLAVPAPASAVRPGDTETVSPSPATTTPAS